MGVTFLDRNYARDHHPRCFTAWLAGGGVKPGFTYGATDDFGYNVTQNPVHVHDLQATILHTLGIDHERLRQRELFRPGVGRVRVLTRVNATLPPEH